ncbi:CHASE2 domain-containing protein [Pararhodospirillum photometricum]|uniref:Adenylate cyclase n=1 Tax=Pararhodospirillum photometricum DSM 122 TaxID=1150469 RepID=H6SIK0_PARPM|nr:adenylate/guanylate cyclase domain-containing protein [Pararhodospirillum photometricum]CCG06627.1 adenylate cyclase [Pararhodospirillum photometricum DSM 122]
MSRDDAKTPERFGGLLVRLVRAAFGKRQPGKKVSWRDVVTSARVWAFLMLCSAVVLRLVDPAPVEFLRSKTFDFYQRIHPRTVDRPLVTIVDIDDRSLQEMGQWPWPRTLMAQLVDRLQAAHPLVIGFDVIFPEPDRTSPGRFVEGLVGADPDIRARLATLPDNDQTFAESLGKARVVLGMAPSSSGAAPQGFEKPQSSIATLGHGVMGYLRDHQRMLYNLPVLDAKARGRGVFIVEGELDGIVRRVPMAVKVERDGLIYPALSVEMLRVAMGASNILLRAKRQGTVEGIQDMVLRTRLPTGQVSSLEIPLDEAGRFHVYFSRFDREKYVSAVDVLRGAVPPERFTNRFVLIGTSAVGLLDIKTTPTETFLPGVEVHANILENLLTGQTLKRPRNAVDLEAWGTLGVGLILIVLVPMIGARWTLALLISLVLGTGAASFWLFREHLQLYDPVFPGLVSLALYLYLTYAGYTREEAERRQVRDAFSRYMSPALVARLAADPSRLKLGGEMRDMTLMFCDVRGFTTISEQFDAEGLTRLINRFLTPMTDVILARQGTIDKYMGDCIMAFWNAPLDDPEHARHAAHSALAMVERLIEVNAGLEQEARETNRRHIPINIGIGLNSGMVCVGNMGSDQRFDYSVLGDTVNLASRLEGQSKTYGVTTVLGEATAGQVADMALLELDLIRVKGKTVPVRIFGLIGDEALAATTAFRETRQTADALLVAYRAQAWAEARRLLELLRGVEGRYRLKGFLDLYAQRLDSYEASPPGETWDGVFVATTK